MLSLGLPYVLSNTATSFPINRELLKRDFRGQLAGYDCLRSPRWSKFCGKVFVRSGGLLCYLRSHGVRRRVALELQRARLRRVPWKSDVVRFLQVFRP
jgi:hypothetical protein